jgi:tetrathionate reductase subunit B
MITRRDFLRYAVIGAAGAAGPIAITGLFTGQAGAAKNGPRWVFLVDTYTCVGCGLCVRACKLENEIPYDANVSRTWVERYVVTKDGTASADSPKAARDGYTTTGLDLGHGKTKVIAPGEIEKAFFVPKLCNQCDNPPCVQVCPVGATYQARDGVVLVDRTWCIGCGYCIMACPYGVRFFHPVYHVAEKCNFCYHRISAGLKPACEIACPFGARRIGNIRDANYYLGLSKEVR